MLNGDLTKLEFSMKKVGQVSTFRSVIQNGMLFLEFF